MPARVIDSAAGVCGLLAAAALALAGCGAGAGAGPRLDAGGPWRAIADSLPPATDPRSSNLCGRGDAGCIDAVVAEMRRRLLRLAAACHHDAAFALMYLRVTEGVAATGNRRFREPRYLNHLDAVFAQLYFRALDAWRADPRKAVPEAWRVAFEAADRRQVTGLGDMLLGMNAHISRDLPFALAAAGLRTPGGRSGKPDFDHVNRLLGDVQAPMIREESRRLDPTVAGSTLPGLGIGGSSVAELIARWRSEAWENARALLTARSAAARARVRRTVERGAAGRARLIASVTSNLVIGPDTAERDHYCRAHRAST